MNLTIVKNEDEGYVHLLEDGVGCLKSKSTVQIERAKRALEFEERFRPLLEKLDRTDSDLLAAVCAGFDAARIDQAVAERTRIVNHIIQELGDERPLP